MSHKDARVESGKKIVLFKASPVIAKNCPLGVTMEFPSFCILKTKKAFEGFTVQSECGASLCPGPDLGVAYGVQHGTHRQLLRNIESQCSFLRSMLTESSGNLRRALGGHCDALP